MLLFGALALIMLYLGSGNLSYQEALAIAAHDRSTLNAEQLSRLQSRQERFSAQAVPACIESSGAQAEAFTLVVEIGPGGQVARSWRQGGSNFAICLQKIASDYFEFRTVDPPFFIAFVYGAEP